MFLKQGPGPSSGHLKGCHTSQLQLSHNRVDTGFLYRGQTPDRTLTMGVHVGLPLKYLGQVMKEGCIAFLPAKVQTEFVSEEPVELFSAAIDLDLIAALAPARLREEGKLESSRGFLREAGGLHATVVKEITSTLTTCLERPNLLKEESYSASLERRFAELAVSALETATPEMRFADRIKLARKAIAFMNDMPDEPISMHMLCKVAGGSQRSLEMGFADLLGVTPKRYLTLLRLHRARDLLLSEKATSVTAAATANEFYHFGRFAELYRHIYGETPVETLRKRTRRQYLRV